MHVQNSVKPQKSFEIENIEGNKCDIVFYANIIETEMSNAEKRQEKIYEYDIYRINTVYRDNIKENVTSNYEKWLNKAKEIEYSILAAEARKKRDQLLKESDAEMCLDRLGIEFPENITATNLLTVVINVFKSFRTILNGNIALYRQKLRDIPQQEGFPYNVVFPQKPESEESEE